MSAGICGPIPSLPVVWFALLSGLGVGLANAQSGSSGASEIRTDGVAQALDLAVPQLLVEGRIPGAVIAVGVRTGGGFQRTVHAWGDLQIEPGRIPMPDDAVFDLASLTKPIATGSALAILLDEGRLSLDDPVARFLPEFDTEAKRPVTIRQLASHSAGTAAYLDKTIQDRLREKHGEPCRGEVRLAVREAGLVAQPGVTHCYSCLNAILLAEIIEQVSGETLDQFTSERVFGPLEMHETGFNPPSLLSSRIVPTTRLSTGNGFRRGLVHDPLAALQGGVSGNAGLFSTAADLARFAEMMLDEGRAGGRQLIRAETVREMTAPQNRDFDDERGVLWDLFPGEGERTVSDRSFGHTGYTGVAIRIYPGRQCYIIALTNRVHPDDSGDVAEFRRTVWTTVLEVLSR
jgi:serine-type D-Ala-D-Ala carboxypeptidase